MKSKQRKRYLIVAVTLVLLIGVYAYLTHGNNPLLSSPPGISPRDHTLPNSPFSYVDPSRLIKETDRTVGK